MGAWAGRTGNTGEKLVGRGLDARNGDSQEGVKRGLTISRNKKSRWRAEGTRAHHGSVVLAIACWSIGQLSKKLCGTHKKGRRV